jgi:hypothetical protein
LDCRTYGERTLLLPTPFRAWSAMQSYESLVIFASLVSGTTLLVHSRSLHVPHATPNTRSRW